MGNELEIVKPNGDAQLAISEEQADEQMNAHFKIKELAHRSNNGVDVWLLWDSEADKVSLRVIDDGQQEDFRIDNVPPEKAMDAFNHPYGYRYSGIVAVSAAYAA